MNIEVRIKQAFKIENTPTPANTPQKNLLDCCDGVLRSKSASGGQVKSDRDLGRNN